MDSVLQLISSCCMNFSIQASLKQGIPCIFVDVIQHFVWILPVSVTAIPIL